MSHFHIRLATPADNAAIARLIRTVMPEFGACGAGFAINDPEVDYMGEAYRDARHQYLVVCNAKGGVVGGGGVAPLVGADPSVCEVRKMYFYAEARGRGVGSQLMAQLLTFARKAEFKTCYLETLSSMVSAQKLYRKFGFTRLEQPLGNTGHGGCDQWYSLML
jgi:putative acetyltransferase